jgi:CubicO group peptidase (beta-lactamase class C family)
MHARIAFPHFSELLDLSENPKMPEDKKVLMARLQQQSASILELLRAGGAPGLSLGVFHHGNIIHTQHFGQRDIDNPATPNNESVYWVASTFKIVTVSAVARLVTDGILGWDVPIREYLPEFCERKDEFGLNATIRDLIANRTGLPMASFYWGQQNGEQLIPKTEFVRIVNHMQSAKPFRSTFVYSQWNFCLLQIIIETVTGKAFGDFVRETIFEPLGLKTATFDTPTGTNIVQPHANRDDGRACKITISSFDSISGLAAGGGGKSSIKDQLRLYIALLAAHKHQTTNNVDTTPGSPFTQLRTIFTPQIRLPGSRIKKQAYCLGLYRTELPGNLSCASLNSALPSEQVPIFGEQEAETGLSVDEIFHHSGTTPGFMSAIFLVPRTQSGVVVLTNATPRCDTADFAAQLLLSVLINTKAPQNLSSLSQSVVKMQFGWYKQLSAFLESCKTDTVPTHPLLAYAGVYWNVARNFKIIVRAQDTCLLLSIQGMPITTYTLKPCDGDTFYWPANREHELVDLGMWFAPFPQWHLVSFTTNEKRVLSLSWQHDRLIDPEQFDKGFDVAEARL